MNQITTSCDSSFPSLDLPKVYIVVLNYNNWPDTLECLESLYGLNYQNFKVIVCDNGSQDLSLHHIQEWADGVGEWVKPQNRIASEKNRIVKKPISCARFDVVQLDGIIHLENLNQYSLLLIDNKENLGFAAGNNTGVQLALKDSSLEYVWILNNDTIVDPDALDHLVAKMTDPQLGACGNTILYYHNPSQVQALGGFTYDTFFGVSRQIGHLQQWISERIGEDLEHYVESRMFGIQGASVFVRKDFLKTVGLMSEEYFLYFEEQDWAERSRRYFLLGYASSAIVYHKEGRTTGSDSIEGRRKTPITDYYLSRNRLLFTRKYYPYRIVTAFMGNVLMGLKRLAHGHWPNALVILVCSMVEMVNRGEQLPYKCNAQEFHQFIKFRLRFPFLKGVKRKILSM
ncbi:MAG: glycosyltransferase family 2 protein [Leptospirales bacterium]